MLNLSRRLLVLVVALVVAGAALAVAGCGGDDDSASSGDSGGGGGSGPAQGSVAKMAGFGLSSPEASRWDQGGKAAFEKAGTTLGAETSWLSNIPFDQSPQLLDRLVRDGNEVMISNGAGFGDAMLDAAKKYPDKWFWVYSALASTKGLKNVVGIDLHWNEIGYLAAAVACKARASDSKKIALIIAQPIPAYTHAAGGIADGAKAGCGSEKDLISTWTGTFDDNAKTKQATEAAIAQGADVIIDFQDAATPGVQSAIKEHPGVKYIGTMFDYHDDIPDQIVTSVAIDYDNGYLGAANKLKNKQLKPVIYPSGVESGGIVLTDFYNSPASVAEYGQQLFDDIKSGKVKVDLTREISK
jgi:basic membrane lipoprotein Med (substrate-binding protein (PBP1-ABC) superfamily)